MMITYAGPREADYLTQHDRHIPADVILRKIERQEILLSRQGDTPAGWLSFNFFWDVIPFMTMLFVEEPYRGCGHGRALVEYWEKEMHRQGYQRVLTSTMSNEQAQHLYRKLGYRDCGAPLLPQEPLEILFTKEIGSCQSQRNA